MRMQRRIALIVGAVLAALLRMGFILTGHNPRHHVQENEQGQLGFGHSHQSQLGFQHDQTGHGWHGRPRLGPRRQRILGEWLKGCIRTNQLFSREGWDARLHQGIGIEVARKGVTVNTISPGYIGTKMVMAIPKEVLDTKILPQVRSDASARPKKLQVLSSTYARTRRRS